MSTKLTVKENARLTELEAVVEHGVNTFIEVGMALMSIQEEKLYRDKHETFEAYCRERWGFGKSHAARLIEAAGVVVEIKDSAGSSMSPNGGHTETTDVANSPPLPANERQARELARLPEGERAGAWKEVVEATGDGKPTAKAVKAIVDKRLPKLIPEFSTMTFLPNYIKQLEELSHDKQRKVLLKIQNGKGPNPALREVLEESLPSREPGEDDVPANGKAKGGKDKPEKEPEPLKDSLDKPIPSHLVEVFGKVGDFQAVAKHFNDALKILKDLSGHPAGALIALQGYELDFRNLKERAKFDKPYCVCPVGNQKTHKPTCACKGRGWLNKLAYGNLPSEYRE